MIASISRSVRRNLRRQLSGLRLTETQILLGLAFAVGIIAGFGAVGFRELISLFTWVFFHEVYNVLHHLGLFELILIPALGALIYSPVIRRFAPEARGHGVPEVMYAVAMNGGRMRPAIVFVKSICSAICIGSGGSVGREGPIVQVGSAMGSSIGQLFGMSDARIRALVAAGAAGGIAATFNAPFAGAFFALEVILGEFNARNFSTVVIASVTADVIGRAFFGVNPSFHVPVYAGAVPAEYPLFLILGTVAALVGLLFTRVLYFSEDLFERWHMPWTAKAVVGGALLGGLGMIVPQGFNSVPSAIFGVGYPTIDAALYGRLALGLMLLFLVAKILAVSLTIGSGGSGGVFAPTLFMGAMLGGSFGEIGHLLAPGFIGPNVSDYAIAGMAAVFAGSAQAPITAIMILFELTNDYTIILPLMLAVVTATLVAHAVSSQTIYTMKLFRRGVDLVGGRNLSVMSRLTVRDAMIADGDDVPPDMPIPELVEHMHSSHRLSFPVVDSDGCFHGMVRAEDIEEELLGQGSGKVHTVGEIVERTPAVFPDESLELALERFSVRDQRRVPVVERDNPDHLLGILQAWDVLSAYRGEVLRAEERLVHTTGSAGPKTRLGPLAAWKMRRGRQTAHTNEPPSIGNSNAATVNQPDIQCEAGQTRVSEMGTTDDRGEEARQH